MPNIITPARCDAAVFKLCLEHGTAVTPAVLNGLWHWFSDVELSLPLPVMEMTNTERRSLALDVLTDMDHELAVLEGRCQGKSLEDQAELVNENAAAKVNGLWRELAGCYASMVNDQVHKVPEEALPELYEHVMDDLRKMTGLDEDGVRDLLHSDPKLRMMLRMSGIDPDQIL